MNPMTWDVIARLKQPVEGGKSESRALEKLQGKQIEVAPHWHSRQFELANQICRERRAVSNAMICSFLPSSPTKAQRQVRDGN
jgi:sigma54-dependent transcription regulator